MYFFRCAFKTFAKAIPSFGSGKSSRNANVVFLCTKMATLFDL